MSRFQSSTPFDLEDSKERVGAQFRAASRGWTLLARRQPVASIDMSSTFRSCIPMPLLDNAFACVCSDLAVNALGGQAGSQINQGPYR